MPEQMASHWNAAGEVDGYMPRFWGLFFLPMLMAGFAALLLFAPLLDPLKANILKFRGTYDWFVALSLAFFLYIHVLTILWSLGVQFEMLAAMAPAFAALLYAAGVLVGKAKRNWFIGIRTPWTLSSETVWEKTHRVGARVFKLAGLLALLALVFPSYAIAFMIAPSLAAAIYTSAYSYVAYRSEVGSAA
jgi:uncharacterized membrane protein